MPIDPKLRVDINHDVAMQRRRDIRERLANRQRTVVRREVIWRAAAIVLLFWLVTYAFINL